MNDLEQVLILLNEIREDQKNLINQQKDIMAALSDIKSFNKRLKQEMDEVGLSSAFLTAHNGYMN